LEAGEEEAFMSTIMVVDDDPAVRSVYKRLLAEEGYRVLEAENGETAVRSILRDKDVDAVLLDIDMPVIDGRALSEMIRLYLPRAKVIVTSVYDVNEQRRLVRKADAYYDKGEGREALLSKIEGTLGKEEA
jgi:CheY-like chemotaxis protein